MRFGLFYAAVSIAFAVAPRAHAEESRGTAIWYRSSEGCPDVGAFLARLAARNVPAHAAEVGDAIDFVVTLGPGSNGSQGLLERQTRGGSVAIRRLDGDDCNQVADGIALGLALATEDASHASKPPEPAAPRAQAAPAPLDAGSQSVAQPAPNGHARTISVGAEGDLSTAVFDSAVLGGAVFAEIEPSSPGFWGGASLRVAVVGETGSASAGGESIHALALFGRLEGCPVSARPGTFRFMPCASSTSARSEPTAAGTRRRRAAASGLRSAPEHARSGRPRDPSSWPRASEGSSR